MVADRQAHRERRGDERRVRLERRDLGLEGNSGSLQRLRRPHHLSGRVGVHIRQGLGRRVVPDGQALRGQRGDKERVLRLERRAGGRHRDGRNADGRNDVRRGRGVHIHQKFGRHVVAGAETDPDRGRRPRNVRGLFRHGRVPLELGQGRGRIALRLRRRSGFRVRIRHRNGNRPYGQSRPRRESRSGHHRRESRHGRRRESRARRR